MTFTARGFFGDRVRRSADASQPWSAYPVSGFRDPVFIDAPNEPLRATNVVRWDEVPSRFTSIDRLPDLLPSLGRRAVAGLVRDGVMVATRTTMLAIRIHETGGAEQLRAEDIPMPEPRPGELRLRVEAAGVNFIDTYHRSGLYKVELPHILGQEAAGVVTAVGEGVRDFRVGNRVATTRANGTYAHETIVAANFAVAVPDGVSALVAAALMLQGMTAHYLACDTFPLKRGDAALIHAGAGGVGLLLTQIAKMRGARVITTVSNEEKAKLSREAGADAVCIYTRENFAEAARAFTDGRGVDVAYDSVGKETFEGTLNSLRMRGMFVSFGNSSGAALPFPPLLLAQKGSLFITRPVLNHYTLTPEELRARAADLFTWVETGRLKVRVGATYPLSGAAEAHRALESRLTTGKVLLLP